MFTKLLLSFVLSLVVTLVVGKFLVPFLRRIKAGQSIKEDGPVWHMSKQGTPTMGGIMFMAGIAVAGIVSAVTNMTEGDHRFFIIFGFALIFAVIGFLDDYEKLKKKQNLGLTSLQKFALQLAAAIVLVAVLRHQGYLSSNLYIPFWNVTVYMPSWLYFVFAAFVIVGTVNSVNLTDGVDGLAAGVTLPVALFYAAISAYWGYVSVGVFGAALAGGLVGFLVYNFHPAKIFMGDTGSLFLGGAVCGAAFALDMPLILIPLGIVYIAETMSDIIQVSYFKLTHGKRVFKMAPLHHHFEMCGWSEEKLFTVFSGVSLVFAVISFLAVMGRYSL
jgi:phospho-N-acetylmuramoyl-pentapeptide-transferase